MKTLLQIGRRLCTYVEEDIYLAIQSSCDENALKEMQIVTRDWREAEFPARKVARLMGERGFSVAINEPPYKGYSGPLFLLRNDPETMAQNFAAEAWVFRSFIMYFFKHTPGEDITTCQSSLSWTEGLYGTPEMNWFAEIEDSDNTLSMILAEHFPDKFSAMKDREANPHQMP